MYYQKDLCEFTGWGQGADTLNRIYNEDKFDEFENLMEELYGETGITETQLNDLLAYDWEWVYEQLGISDSEEEE